MSRSVNIKAVKTVLRTELSDDTDGYIDDITSMIAEEDKKLKKERAWKKPRHGRQHRTPNGKRQGQRSRRPKRWDPKNAWRPVKKSIYGNEKTVGGKKLWLPGDDRHPSVRSK